MALQQIQWGTIILHLHNETFQKASTQGRSMYFDDSEYDIPHVAHHMDTLDAVGSVLDEDGKGGYRFDRTAFNGPFGIRYLAVTSTSTGKATFHPGKRVRHRANHYARLRKRLQQKGSRCGGVQM